MRAAHRAAASGPRVGASGEHAAATTKGKKSSLELSFLLVLAGGIRLASYSAKEGPDDSGSLIACFTQVPVFFEKN